MPNRTQRQKDQGAEKQGNTQVKVAIITGIVAIFTTIVTAIAGPVILRLVDRTPAPTAITSQAAATQPGPVVVTGGSPVPQTAATAKYKPMSEAIAVITAIDGTQTGMPADTLRWCINEGTSIIVDTGSVALDTVRHITLTQAGDRVHYTITLLDDSVVQVEGGACSFIGQAPYGRVDIPTAQIQSIDIQR